MEAVLKGVYVGVDVAKHHWDVAIAGRRGVRRFMADAAGQAELMAWLEKLKAQLVCLEATGGYERSLRASLQKRNFRVSVVKRATNSRLRAGAR